MSKGSKKSVSDIVKSWYRDRNKWTEATWALEFKSGKNGFPKTWWETYQETKQPAQPKVVCPCPDPNDPCPQCVTK